MAEFVKMEGLKESVAALRALPREFSGTNGGPIRGALYAAANLIKKAAQARAPVDTGNLKAQVYVYRDRAPVGANERFMVTVRTGRKKGRILQLLRVSRKDAYYWFMVEFGTSKMSAQPFMRPAFEETKGDAVKLFETEFVKGVAKAESRARRAMR